MAYCVDTRQEITEQVKKMIFRKELEYTDDSYDSTLEILEKKTFRKMNIATIALMAVFLVILIVVSLISRVYALLIIGLAIILAGGIFYVFRSSDLKIFIDTYSPEKWSRKFLRHYIVTLHEDKITVGLFERNNVPLGSVYSDEDSGFIPRTDYSYPDDDLDDLDGDEFFIGDDDAETVFTKDDGDPENAETASAPEGSPVDGKTVFTLNGSPEDTETVFMLNGSPEDAETVFMLDGSPEDAETASAPDGSPEDAETASAPDGSPEDTETVSAPDGSPEDTETASAPDGSPENTAAEVMPAVKPKENRYPGPTFVFDYDPLSCRCFESDEAFLIYRKIYDCMPVLKEQLTEDDIWVFRSYFSERMGKKFVRLM